MNRIDKYCIAFSCFLINFLHLLKNAFAFGPKRKCVLLKTQVRFESNASTFSGGFRRGVKEENFDGLSGLAGIFIKYIYAGCGKIQRLYFSTPVYRKFEKPVPTPTTRQAAARKCHGFGTRSCGGGYGLMDLLFSVWHHFYGVISCVSRCDS